METNKLVELAKNKNQSGQKLSFWKSDRAILMVCIGIAFVFWLFTKLSYVYRSTLTVELVYELPADKVLSSPPPSSLELDVEASGWELLRLHFRSKKYIMDVSLSDNLPKNLNSITIKGKIARQLPEDLTILELHPDLIQLVPEDLASKTIPIVLDNQVMLDEQYQFKDSIAINPSAVRISGPASVVADIDSWITLPLIKKNVSTGFQTKIGIKPHPNANIKFDPATVAVQINVEQITEKKLEVEIERRGVPDSILLVLLPQRITISCIVGLEAYDDLNAEEFSAFVDFSKIDLYNQHEIKIELESFPDYVRQINYHPKKADYIIRQQ
jgi:hypothetical protein